MDKNRGGAVPEQHDALIDSLVNDRYRVEGVLGRGGAATVYRARDEFLGRSVALKILGMGMSGAAELDRGASEMALLASLSHPALVTLFDAFTMADGHTCLVMELVEGPDLGARLELGPLGESDITRMCIELAEALHTAHSRGVVHRDIKPANVLLGPSHHPNHEFTAKLADFGIAHLLDSTRVTATGTMVGTAAYLSPEQAEGKPPGSPADIYSLGLVILETFTRERAFPGTLMESVAARLSRDPVVPDSLPPGWPALLRSMTDRDPAARPTAIDAAMAAHELGIANSASITIESEKLEAARDALDDDATRAMGEPYSSQQTVAAASAIGSAPQTPDAATAPSSATLEHDRLAETRVLTASSGGVAVETSAPDDAPRERSRPPFVLVIAGLIVLLIVVGIGAAIAMSGAAQQGSGEPSPTLPALEGELGEHVQELFDEVNE